MLPKQETLLTARDVAERLHCGVRKVRTMLEAGRLQGVRLGNDERGHWRVTAEEVERFIAEGQA